MKVMICIKDLFAEAVKKLWIVILCMVVCCVAVTALRYNKDRKEADIANNMGTISDVQTELSIQSRQQISLPALRFPAVILLQH